MSHSKNIQSIEILLHDLQNLFTQQKNEAAIHPLDLDLMQQKTRELYDVLLHLNVVEEEGKPDNLVAEPVLENASQDNIPEIVPIPEYEDSSDSVEEIHSSEPKWENAEETIVPPDETPSMTETIYPENPQPKSDELKEEIVRTTLDLFSEPTATSLGERLTNSEQSAVAETIQKKHINDLREAIGINDKFLFINELFYGDLGKYNKVLDELNSLSSLRGAQTYLTELSVQYQWNEEHQAFLKLSEVLDRKFA